MGRSFLLLPLLPSWLTLLWLASFQLGVSAQPSPEVQDRITTAIASAKNATELDYTAFANPFIGTDNDGNVFPGASVPFGVVKIATDVTVYAPAGYVAGAERKIRGLSPLHDSGTGSSLGSYGNFEIMPLLCPDGFESCTTRLADRERYRKNDTDDAYPGYFAQTMDNDIKMEATSTRRAGLERFTFPAGSKPYFVLDLANNLAASFAGGTLDIDSQAGRITTGGMWGPSFGPSSYYTYAYACYDLHSNANGTQTLDEYGMWTGDDYGLDWKVQGAAHLNLTQNLIGGTPSESGALFSLKNISEANTITIRVGISFISTDQACENAESEIGDASFEEIVARSKALWQDKLKRIELDVSNTLPNVTQLLYSSLYRSFLTPFRTFYPLMSLHSPIDFANIVGNYIDGWRKAGWLPECRANNRKAWSQGGSDGDNIVSHFAIAYHNEADQLGVDIDEVYSSLITDAEEAPPEWNIHGRQAEVYKEYGYVPYAVFDADTVGRQTREGSRTLEYAFNDFGVRQVALLVNSNADVETYTNRSLSYRNVWDPTVQSDGFNGFMQKKLPNGTFVYTDPIDCSPLDTNTSRACSLQENNVVGFYESSSWEYSLFVPHDIAYLIELMGGNDTFVDRVDHYFEAILGLGTSLLSTYIPVVYHYANRPTKSVDRVRDVVVSNFDTTPGGLPGNDDQGSMGTLLIFHLLGLYPVPSTSQLLVLSPFVPKYTVHNTFLNTSTTVTVTNFDPNSVQQTIPSGVAAYVQNVTINGKPTESRCYFDFYDTFRLGGDIEITLTADKDAVDDCAGSVPDSLSSGGFVTVR